jgi:ATP-dependent Zn protease
MLEVKSLVEEGHQRALAILRNNRELMETITQKLLEAEVIEGRNARRTPRAGQFAETRSGHGLGRDQEIA